MEACESFNSLTCESGKEHVIFTKKDLASSQIFGNLEHCQRDPRLTLTACLRSLTNLRFTEWKEDAFLNTVL